MPALICAWRLGIWPCPACSTVPITTCSTCSGATSARWSASRIATPPRCVAGSVERPPPSLPIGVRALLRITVRGMQPSLLTCAGWTSLRLRTPRPPRSADTIVVGVFEDEGIAHDHDGVLQALVDSGEAKRGLRKLAVTHAGGRRYIVAGLGGAVGVRSRARAGRRGGRRRAREGARDARRCAGRSPTTSPTRTSGALVEGTLLAAYVFREYKSGADDDDGRGARSSCSRPPRRQRRRGVRGDGRRRRSTPPATSRTARRTTSRPRRWRRARASSRA